MSPAGGAFDSTALLVHLTELDADRPPGPRVEFSVMGGAAILFSGPAALAGLFGDVATAERLLECFEVESSRGLALVEAQDGGLTPQTRLCLVAHSFEHPVLFALRIGVPLDALAVHVAHKERSVGRCAIRGRLIRR